MPKKVIAYHVKDGPVEMYSINVREAVTTHPDEWSMRPFTKAQATAPVTRMFIVGGTLPAIPTSAYPIDR
ncbi:hypothetical protein [Methylobacterium iners]|uniref:Uncharacterized protein n=1 Tax=Methylobacterium iners TaxID=418707 RepID=A0ABQ4RVA6_9HYPH|nr:hypothetical protein [Methylobacterium iners]GJD94144.1 hypothetical protein OCOJLMKI_1346 [Methylobacterium iners]